MIRKDTFGNRSVAERPAKPGIIKAGTVLLLRFLEGKIELGKIDKSCKFSCVQEIK